MTMPKLIDHRAPPALAALPLALLLVLHAAPARAQVELPSESPPARVTQQVGLTEIAVEYTSSAVRGRRIWGGVVPYGKPWAISADRPTIIRFSKDVTMAGKAVAAGRYELFAIPARERDRNGWALMLRRAELAAAAPDDDDAAAAAAPAIRVPARARSCTHRERLTFLFSDFTSDRTSLDLEWERVHVSVPISTDTAGQVLAGIGELDTTWRSYANAARFMLETQKDFDAGLRYANQSLALKQDWYTFWIKAALLAAKHDYRAAVVEGERAYELGRALGDGFILEPDLKKALADWKKRR